VIAPRTRPRFVAPLRSDSPPWVWACIAAWVLLVGGAGGYLAFTRHFQVDEFQNLSNLTYTAGMRGENWATGSSPWQVWLSPLVSLARGSTESMLLAARAVFFAFFAVNFTLVAWADPHSRGPAEKVLVLWLATLTAVFWRHGFEVRHDVLIVTAQMVTLGLTQSVLRDGARKVWRFAVGGFVLALLAANTVKGLAHGLPYAVLLLLAAAPTELVRPWRRRGWPALAMLGGAAFAAILCLLTMGLSGGAEFYARWVSNPAGVLDDLTRHSALHLLGSVPIVTLFLALVGAAAITRSGVSGGPPVLTPRLVCLAYLGVSAALVLLNPTPYAYNLLTVAGPLVLVAAEGVRHLRQTVALTPARLYAGLALLLFAEWGTTCVGSRYVTASNDIQLSFVRAAEALTGPHDPVLDGVGMVLTREAPGPHWLLHSSLRKKYERGERTSLKHYLEVVAPPAVITNYRWRWLPREHYAPLKAHYIRLTDDFYVLGGRVKETDGAATIQVRRAGRYAFQSEKERGAVRIDGVRYPANKPVELTRGAHQVKFAGKKGSFRWVGPRLTKPPVLTRGDGSLFVAMRDL
jgi:hypothetical protein